MRERGVESSSASLVRGLVSFRVMLHEATVNGGRGKISVILAWRNGIRSEDFGELQNIKG